VQLQVQEALRASGVHRFDGCRPNRGVELETYLERADMLAGLVDQRFRRVEVGNIERKCDARRWVVVIHESPQQRYGAD